MTRPTIQNFIRLAGPAAFAVMLFGTTGCDIYFGNDTPPCEVYPAGDPATDGMRNPDTGQCEYFGGGGYQCYGDGCCSGGGAIGAEPGGGAVAYPAWGACESECTGLSEGTCSATPGCQTAYVTGCPANALCEDLDPGELFVGCWQVSPAGGTGGVCESLDAWGCSGRDDCRKVHEGTPGNIENHFYCGSEVPDPVEFCMEDSVCGPGFRCTVDEECITMPCDADPNGGACPEVCYGRCVGSQGSCVGDVYCDAPPPYCATGFVPAIADGCYTGACIAESQCDDPGNCAGEVLCDSLPPLCNDPSTVPGIADGCWTGECVSTDACTVPLEDCHTVTDEALCIAQTACTPYYEGENCSCDGMSCTCQDWNFQSCL